MTRKSMADDIFPGDLEDDILPGDATRDTVDAIGADPDGSLFRRLKGWTKASIDHLAEWRKEADESYEFYNGYQWSGEELAIFEADGRPAPVFNLVQINIDALAGLEVNNRQNVKYLPRTAGDVQVDELLSSAAMWVRDQARSEREESDAFTDAAIAGIGVTETRKPEPDAIAIDRRDPRTAFWDRNATKRNLADRRYAGRVVWLDLDEAEDMFPDVPHAELNAKWAAYGVADSDPGTEHKDYAQHQREGQGIPDNNRPKRICMVEIEWYDFEDGRKVYKQAFLGQTGVIEVNPLEAWAYNFITGKRDEKKKIWYGIVRSLKDPQRILNKFLATVIHILASNAKGGLIYERGAFADQRKAEEDWSNPQKNVEVTEGALVNGRIRNREAPQLPQGAVMLIEFTMQNISRVSGINVELLGSADRDQPASLEMQRRQSAVSTQASLFDSKRFYHVEQGRTLLALMKTLPPETLVRVTVDPFDPAQALLLLPPQPPGNDPQAMAQWQQQAQAVQAQIGQAREGKSREVFVAMATIAKAFKDDTIRFDVIADEAPSSPNQQQDILGKLAILSHNGMQLPPEAQAVIVENIGLPAAMADTLVKAIGGNDPRLKALQGELQQGAQQLQAAQAENQKLKADRAIEAQKLQIDAMRADTERSKVHAEILAQTGGVAAGDKVIPSADVIAALSKNVDQLNQAVSAILQAARGQQ